MSHDTLIDYAHPMMMCEKAMKKAHDYLLEGDYVLAMDEVNRAALRRLCPAQYRDRVKLFLEFAPDSGRREVPDPYYGGSQGFEEVLDLVESAAHGLLQHIRTNSLS